MSNIHNTPTLNEINLLEFCKVAGKKPNTNTEQVILPAATESLPTSKQRRSSH